MNRSGNSSQEKPRPDPEGRGSQTPIALSQGHHPGIAARTHGKAANSNGVLLAAPHPVKENSSSPGGQSTVKALAALAECGVRGEDLEVEVAAGGNQKLDYIVKRLRL